ncbi:MAG TPA: protein phosphatase 2C domain-containing protein [Thermoanaerobaculia bacterium]|nr:protein phosphatase 2C domain-containing protein [Thermoanaerobaculia bacterium]
MATATAKRPLSACLSDPGLARENNEDRVLCDPERGIYAVIDGVGGESGGEIAAQTATEILQARLSRRTTDASRLIREAIALANKQIWERAQANPALAGMACVLTVAVVDDGQVTIGHVGDSRLYLLKSGAGRGEIKKITKDHSPVGAREDTGEISEAEAMAHPRRNEIFRDVGSAPHEPDEEGFIDITRIAFEPDSALLICSDGLSDLVASRAILEAVEANAGNPKRAAQALIDAANQAGGKDNVSVVLVEGERYAAAVRKARPELATRETPRPAQARGAAAARRGAGSRLLGAFVSRPAFLIYGAILGAFAFAAFGQSLLGGIGQGTGRASSSSGGNVLRVGGEGGAATIAEALGQASPGDTVEVMPGTYREALQLRSGVSLVSRMPRGAVLLPPPGSGVPALSAQSVVDARVEGFRIAGDAQAPLQVGIRLADSDVGIDGVEITGAQTAAIDLAESDRSEVRYSLIHENPGGGVLVESNAAPRLIANLIAGNGRAPGAPARPGVEVRDGARPDLVENRFEGNAGGGVLLPSQDRAAEVYAWNTFPGAGRAEAVRAPAAPPPAQPAAPQPAAPRRRGRP